jgi:hypothetical protein
VWWLDFGAGWTRGLVGAVNWIYLICFSVL